MGVLRLAHVDISAPDLELAAAYYTQVIGMDISERTEDSLYLKCWDERDHHSVAVRFDPRVGIDRFSFKVEHEDDLDHFERRIEQYGYAVERVSKGDAVGQGESIRFETPSGHEMELVADITKVGGRLPLLNPAPYVDGLVGIAPPRLDHLLIHAEEVPEMAHFMRTTMDFHLTEQVLSGEGHMMGAFLQRSLKPHDIAIIQGPNGALHHFAFWLDDWDHVRRAADILAYNGISIDIGPTRHGITRGNTIYFFDPMGTRNEVFTGGYRPDPDFPTITWTEDQLGRAIFYYEGRDNGRFLTVHT
ncbi:MAG: catechol 2,3-dioxygenase [Acidobacteriota bacterium]|nr:catechol 2,3-dioxygenase [Acidobacteriota bacterium]